MLDLIRSRYGPMGNFWCNYGRLVLIWSSSTENSEGGIRLVLEHYIHSAQAHFHVLHAFSTFFPLLQHQDYGYGHPLFVLYIYLAFVYNLTGLFNIITS